MRTKRFGERRIISYSGTPVQVGNTLQKIVSKFEKSCSDIPELIKGSLFDPNECNQLPADVVKAFESTGLGMTVSVVDQDLT